MLSNQQITACVNKMCEYVYIPGLSQIESCVLFPGNLSGNPSTLHLFSTKLLHHWHVHNFFYLSLRQKLFKSILLCQWFAVIRLHIEILFFATYGFTLIRIFYHPCIRGDDWNKRKKYYFSKHERYFGGGTFVVIGWQILSALEILWFIVSFRREVSHESSDEVLWVYIWWHIVRTAA